MPRVAIAMAVFDDERYLPQTLEALATQSTQDFHLTVYDDASRDRSAEVAEGFAQRMPLTVIRGSHRGRHLAKVEARRRAVTAPYLLVLDSDVELPRDALARMTALLDADPRVAVVSAIARAFEARPYGRAQAFIEDVFFHSNADAEGQGRWIVGGCAMFRGSAIEGIEVRSDLGEDNDLSEKLRRSWRILAPLDLVAVHHGVPTTLGGVLLRFQRDGVRVRAMLRAYPGTRQLGNLARLAPLPLALLLLGGAACRSTAVAGAAGALLFAYVGAFLWASRRVVAPPGVRLAGALLFAVGNLGFGFGYLREALRGRSALMREPERPAR